MPALFEGVLSVGADRMAFALYVQEELASRRKTSDAQDLEQRRKDTQEIERHRHYLSAVAAAEQRARKAAKEARRIAAQQTPPAKQPRILRTRKTLARPPSPHRVVVFNLPYKQKGSACYAP